MHWIFHSTLPLISLFFQLCHFFGRGYWCVIFYILFFFKRTEAWFSSTWSTLGSSIYLSLLSNLVPIKVDDIFSSLLTTELYKSFNCAKTVYSASWRRSTTLYQKHHRSRTSFHSKTEWVLYQRELSHSSTSRFLSV